MNKITKLKKILHDLDNIAVDCFEKTYPSHIPNHLTTAYALIQDALKETKKYEGVKYE